MWECRLLLASSPDDALGPSGSGGSIPGGRRGVNVDRVGMLDDHPIGVVCDTRIDAAAPLHLAEAYPGLGVAPQVDAACGVSDGMLAASHRIAAGPAVRRVPSNTGNTAGKPGREPSSRGSRHPDRPGSSDDTPGPEAWYQPGARANRPPHGRCDFGCFLGFANHLGCYVR